MYDPINSLKLFKRKNSIDIFNKDGKYFFIQAPKGFCNKKIEINQNYIWISYLKENRFKKEFYEYLNLLKLKLEKLLNGQIIETFYYENGMGINIQNFRGNNIIDLYYNKETYMDIIECPERFYIKPLLWVQNVRNVNSKWYINFCIIQAIIYPIYLRLGKCLIEDNQTVEQIYKSKILLKNIQENEESVSYLNHPVYGKYFRMISMGIPKGAVQIKLINELGENSCNILDHNPEDRIIIRKIKQSEHLSYVRFFRMLSIGIPRMAVEQKMVLENIDKEILNDPDKLIMDLPVVLSDFSKMLSLKKLRKSSIKFENKKEIKSLVGINVDDILKRREQILNKLNK